MRRVNDRDLPPIICDRLARGLQTSIFRDVETLLNRPRPRIQVEAGTGLKGLRRRALAFKRNMGKLNLDAVFSSRDGVLHLMSAGLTRSADGRTTFLSAHDHRIDLYSCDPVDPGRDGVSLCLMSPHAVRRIIQRQRTSSLENMFRLLRAGADWSLAAMHYGYRGNYCAPLEDGFLACGSEPWSDDGARSFRDVHIKTFIGHDQMTEDTRKRWSWMVSRGALERRPRISDDLISMEDFREVFAVMIEDGQRWEARRDHAMMRREGRQECTVEPAP